MKADRVMAWVMENEGFPCQVEITRVPAPELVVERLAFDPHEVLCIVDESPFARTRKILALTDEMPGRPVIITVTGAIDVPTSVELMEQGVFTIVSGWPGADRISAAISRAIDNRRAFEKILDISQSLQRSKSSLEKKTLELSVEKIKLRRKVTEVTLMRKVAEWLGRSKTLEEGISEVLPHLTRFVGAAYGVFLVSPEKDRWIECDTGVPGVNRLLLPRTVNHFRRAVPLVFSPDTMRIAVPREAGEVHPNAVAFPIRVKRRFLGYGIFWGEELPPPAQDTLRLLEAVGVQMGVFSQNISLQEQVETDRDRLARANEELNFLFRLATALHEDPDMDSVIEWLCREIGRFVPCTGMEIVSLVGAPTVRTCGHSNLHRCERKDYKSYAAAWADYLSSHHQIPAHAEDFTVRVFPYLLGASAGEKTEAAETAGHRWETVLSFGRRKLGLLVVHLPVHSAAERGRDRILKAVAAQLSLFLHNVAERETVRAMATHDFLTGLLNFRSFQDNFDREFERFVRYSRNLSLLMIDLDNFKRINDTFGHQVGDQVLREVGEILKKNLRKTDYAFRYGGDEFVVMMPDRSCDQAMIFAQRVRASVKQEIRGVHPYQFSLSLSIGIADCAVLSSKTKEELLQRADGALYQAKTRGRDRIQVAEAVAPAPVTVKGELHAVEA